MFFDLLADVYSATNLFTPVNLVGVGANSSVEAGQTAFVTMDVFDTATQPIASSPITFPCANSTNVAMTNSQSLNIPDSGGEIGTVGPEILVMGNSSDHIVLTSGTMTSPTGGSFALTLLDSANDPNKLLQPFQSVAYVTANDLNNILPSTTYAVSINGTVNGTPFSRNFTMTTEDDGSSGSSSSGSSSSGSSSSGSSSSGSSSSGSSSSGSSSSGHTHRRGIRGDLPVEVPGRGPIDATTPVFSAPPIKGVLPVEVRGRAPIHAPEPIFNPGGLPDKSPAHSSGTSSIKGTLPVDIPGRAPIHAPSPILFPEKTSGDVLDTTRWHASGESSATTRTSTASSGDSTTPISVGQR